MWRLSFYQNGVALGPAPGLAGGLISGDFALRPAVSLRKARSSVVIRACMPPIEAPAPAREV